MIATPSRDRPGDVAVKDKRKGAPSHSTQVEPTADSGLGRTYLDFIRHRAATDTERQTADETRGLWHLRVKKGRWAVPTAPAPMSERNAGEDIGFGTTHRRAGAGSGGPLESKPVGET